MFSSSIRSATFFFRVQSKPIEGRAFPPRERSKGRKGREREREKFGVKAIDSITGFVVMPLCMLLGLCTSVSLFLCLYGVEEGKGNKK